MFSILSMVHFSAIKWHKADRSSHVEWSHTFVALLDPEVIWSVRVKQKMVCTGIPCTSKPPATNPQLTLKCLEGVWFKWYLCPPVPSLALQWDGVIIEHICFAPDEMARILLVGCCCSMFPISPSNWQGFGKFFSRKRCAVSSRSLWDLVTNCVLKSLLEAAWKESMGYHPSENIKQASGKYSMVWGRKRKMLCKASNGVSIPLPLLGAAADLVQITRTNCHGPFNWVGHSWVQRQGAITYVAELPLPSVQEGFDTWASCGYRLFSKMKGKENQTEYDIIEISSHQDTCHPQEVTCWEIGPLGCSEVKKSWWWLLLQ